MVKKNIPKLKDVYEKISTPEERLFDLVEYLEKLIPQLDPEKLRGIDGIDGIDGVDGKDAVVDHDYIIEKIISRIKVPRDGRDGKDVDYEVVTKAMLGKLKNEKKLDISVFQLKDWEKLYRPPGNVIATSNSNPSGGGGYTYNEIPSGFVDGTNVTFTLSHTPTQPNLILVLLGGVIVSQLGAPPDYSIVGNTITFTYAPVVGTFIQVYYS